MILEAFNVAVVFIFGLIFGSFFNVCIYRIPKKKSVFFPGSACTSCKNPIKWYDNIPVLSYILLRGKCRNCSSGISLRYPIIELMTGIIFVLFFLKFGLEKIYFSYIIIIGYLIVLTFIDIDGKVVPNGIILLFIFTGFALNLAELNGFISVFDGIIAGSTAAFVIYVLHFFSNGKIGEGDIKLFMCLGICLGMHEVIKVILYSFIIGAVISGALLLSGKFKRKDEIAFVPFIAAAVLLESLIL